MPKTKYVALGARQGEKIKSLGFARWEDVEAAAGELMVPTGMWPERWRVVEFPTDEQLRAMNIAEGPG